MLNCKQATALMSQGMDKKLGILQSASLHLHLLMCDGCQNFNKHMQFLREGLRKFQQRSS